jgi:hypothetical protein
MSDWTDESKQELVDSYVKREPTAETSNDIVVDLAEELDKTANGVRNILVRAGVYITKNPTSSSSGDGGGTADKPKRKSKQESIDELTALLDANNVSVDESILNKLTGKAADAFTVSFTALIEKLTSE